MCMALIEMGHVRPPTSAVTESATGDGFINENIRQRHSIAIDMRFYWVRYRVKKRQFMVYQMVGENNLEDYFTKHHLTSHHQAQRSLYLVPTTGASKYTCYMLPFFLQGCVESLPARGNGRRKDKVSLLCGKETDDGRTETNRSNRLIRYWRR